jgi:hypothetical protein
MTSVVKRRQFIRSVWIGLLATPIAVEAQRVGKIARIGILSPSEPVAML